MDGRVHSSPTKKHGQAEGVDVRARSSEGDRVRVRWLSLGYATVTPSPTVKVETLGRPAKAFHTSSRALTWIRGVR